jgi:hypothetical protein
VRGRGTGATGMLCRPSLRPAPCFARAPRPHACPPTAPPPPPRQTPVFHTAARARPRRFKTREEEEEEELQREREAHAFHARPLK